MLLIDEIKNKLNILKILDVKETISYSLPGSVKKYEIEAINKYNNRCSIDVYYAFTKDFLKQNLIDFLPSSLNASFLRQKQQIKYIVYFYPQKEKINIRINIVPKKYLIHFEEVKHYYFPTTKLNTHLLLTEHKKYFNNIFKIDIPLLSFIIPTYNSEKYIEQVLQSVFSQNYPNKEIIIIDNLSTDNTINIAKKYLSINDLIISEKDNGIFDAINKGTYLSKGKYSLFLGSDDILLKDTLTNFFISYNKTSNLDFYFGDVYIAHYNILKHNDTFIKNASPGRHNIAHPALFINKLYFKKLGGFSLDYKICSDADFKLKLIKIKGSYIKLPGHISIYRAGGFSYLNPAALKEAKRIYKKHNVINIIFYLQYIKFLFYWIYKRYLT